MKLSFAATYALRAVVYMAAQKETRSVSSQEIAKKRELPERFLLKVLKPLVSAGILQSVRGPGGGYRLARPATKITLLEVVEAVDGHIRGEAPYEGVNTGGLQKKIENVCKQAAELVRRQYQKVRISDLLGK
jgi:Rrf2 family protein